MTRSTLAGLLLLVCCLYSLLARDTYGSDFRAYYVAAGAAHAGLDPYLNQVNVSEQFADRDWLEVNSRFIYPPSSLLLFAPFARLPYRMAKVVWGTGMALLMAGLLLALCRRYPQADWMALGLFLSLPMASNIDNGQVDILVLALTLAVVLVRRPWLAGLCLGAAIAIKLSPALVLLWLLARRRWATAAWATLSGAALLATGAAVYGRMGEFVRHLRVHLAPGAPQLSHTFTTFQVLYGRFVVMGANTYSLHYFYGTRQNPLRMLGPAAGAAGLALVLAYVAWILWSRAGKRLAGCSESGESGEVSLFGFLAVALFANALLWPAGLVACFPLSLALVARSRHPVAWGLALLAPFYLPIELVGAGRFTLWCLVLIAWIWREGWAQGAEFSEKGAVFGTNA